ncbi:hypothetical protein CCHR01_06624 [Colletotrichum chrysophilum]|uniref:Uncharacterized protein n=1 Tax=Colletotrichum chrysophilum TaxID=1836956 RepID=A0AAD9AMR1_9PEZI|nr:hypothetical protein CCHR01_06624 [Colletotrichum chrysophilum]
MAPVGPSWGESDSLVSRPRPHRGSTPLNLGERPYLHRKLSPPQNSRLHGQSTSTLVVSKLQAPIPRYNPQDGEEDEVPHRDRPARVHGRDRVLLHLQATQNGFTHEHAEIRSDRPSEGAVLGSKEKGQMSYPLA